MQTQPRRRRSPRSRMPKWVRCLIAVLALVLLFYAAFQITLWVIGGTSGDNDSGDESGVVVSDNDPEKLKQKLEASEDTIAELKSTIEDLEAQLERYSDKYGSLDGDASPKPDNTSPTPTPRPTSRPSSTPAPRSTPRPTSRPTPRPTSAPTPRPTAAPLPTVAPEPTVNPGFLSEGGI